ncbi:MAG: GNAT family N-acetyltransferase [Clostridiales bacterium]|nr:GNAT family N-acetyltransferase [Clostridiales bacterium]
MRTFETKDLIIRPSQWSDLDCFYTWERDEKVTEFFSINDDQSWETLAREYIHHDESPSQMQFTILMKETNAPVGRIILGDIEEKWKLEIWRIYIANTELRGKGYGRQAMTAIMHFCFEELEMKRVYLDHYTDNPASFLYQSLGFKYEGILRDNCRKNGILRDVHLMAMLKNEYFA